MTSSKLLLRIDPNTNIKYALFKCPGCECSHEVRVVEKDNNERQTWEWNGSMESPTFKPSILCHFGNHQGHKVCHSFVTDGKIQFLADCTHKLAGQTVDLPNVEDI